MNITIKATRTTLTDAIRSDVELKLQSLESFLRSEDIVHVEIAEDTKHHTGRFSRVEVRIQPHGHYAEANGNDFYEAMDLVVPKIRQQLTRSKDKKTSLRRKLGSFFKRR